MRLWGLGIQTWGRASRGHAVVEAGRRWRPEPAGRCRAVSTLWHGRFAGGPADELLAFTVSLAVRPAAGGRRPGRQPGPRPGPGPAGSSPRTRPTWCWRPSTRSRTSCGGGRSPSSPPTRTSTPPSSGGSPSWPGRPAPSSTPAAAATTRWPPTCACGAKRELAAWPAGCSALQRVLLDRAREAGPAYLPGYTHLQRAQPVLLAHHLLAHGWALAATSTGCSTAGGGSTCRRWAPGRWPGRRCRSTPTARPSELGFAARSRTASTR